MENLFQQTRYLLQNMQEMISRFEVTQQPTTLMEEKDVSKRMQDVNKNLELLSSYVLKEPLNRRQESKRRLDQLRYDVDMLRSVVDNFKRKNENKRYEMQREELLLNQQFTANDTSINMGGPADSYIRERNQLEDAHRVMDELLQHGEALHQNILEGGNILKRAHGKVNDILGSLGLSDSLMTMIDKRQTMDKYILGFGILTCLIIMWLVVHYLS